MGGADVVGCSEKKNHNSGRVVQEGPREEMRLFTQHAAWLRVGTIERVKEGLKTRHLPWSPASQHLGHRNTCYHIITTSGDSLSI